MYINEKSQEAAMTRARHAGNETDGVARIILRLNNTKYADGNRPKNITAEARALWRKENGIQTGKGKKKWTEAEVSISGAMQRLGMIKSDMYVTSKAVSMAAGELINEGMRAQDKTAPSAPEKANGSTGSGKKSVSSVSNRLENSYADHLLGSKDYTDMCLGKNESGSYEGETWQFKHGTFENIKDDSGLYMPRKESQVWDKDAAQTHLNFVCEEIDVGSSLNKLRHFKGDLKSDFKYMSILLHTITAKHEEEIETFLIKFFRLPVNGKHMLESTVYTPAINDIKNAIRGILSEEDGFRFHAATVRPFKTRHYLVNVCEINGWLEFELENIKYRVELCRKMVVLNTDKMLSPKNPTYIPVCEELFMQISRKHGDVETYHEHGMYITCKPRPPPIQVQSPGKSNFFYSQQIHYFGNNAFTMNTTPCNTEPFDKNKDTMKMVGAVVRRLQGVGSDNKGIAHQTYECFKKIIDAPDLVTTDSEPSSTTVPETNIVALKKSFLANQHANDQTAVVDDKHPSIRIWMSSKSFSIVCVSPAKYPALNYVYVHLWESKIKCDEVSKIINPNRMYPHSDPKYRNPTDGTASAFPKNTPYPLQPGDSTLPIELELELALL